MKVNPKRRRRVTKNIVLGRTLNAADAEFATQYTADTAQRAPTASLSALAMLGLGLTQIHSLFPLTTGTTLMLVFCAACLTGGILFYCHHLARLVLAQKAEDGHARE